MGFFDKIVLRMIKMGKRNIMIENKDELMDESTHKESQETSEETQVETEENMEDLDVYQDNFPKDKKIKRHTRALKMVSEAKILADDVEEQIHSSTLLLESDLDVYAQAREDLFKNGLDACIDGLQKVGVNIKEDVAKAKNCTVFTSHDVVNAMQIKGVSRSKFASFLFALVFGLIAAIVLMYLATKMLGLGEEMNHISSMQRTEMLFTWFSSWLGMKSMAVGTAVYASTVLLLIYLSYLLRTLYKANANLHFAAKQLAETELYSEIKQDAKYKLNQVDAHVKESIALLHRYAIFCNEQQGTLHRIIYVEGEKENVNAYNRRSSREIKRTQILVEQILDFLSVPVSKESKLHEVSVGLLYDANGHIDKLIERLYRIRKDDMPERRSER